MKLQISQHLQPIVKLVLLTMAVAFAAGTLGMYRYGSLGNALAAMNGQLTIVRPPVISVSNISPGDSRLLSYAISNLTNHPIKILGAVTSCKCTKINSSFSMIPARETVLVELNYKPTPEQTGRDYKGRAKFYVDDPSIRQIELGFEACVTAPKELSRH